MAKLSFRSMELDNFCPDRLPGLGGVFDAPRAALVDSAELLTEGSGLGASQKPPVTHVCGQLFAARRSESHNRQQQQQVQDKTKDKEKKSAWFVIGDDNLGYDDVGDYYCEDNNNEEEFDGEFKADSATGLDTNQPPPLPYTLVGDHPDGAGRSMVLHLGETEQLGERLKRDLTDMLEFAEEELHCRRVLLGVSRLRQDKDTLMKTLPFLGFACYEPRTANGGGLTGLDADGFAYMAYTISD